MILKYDIQKEGIVKEFLQEEGLSRNILKQVRVLDNITINGETAKNWYKIYPGDKLELTFQEEMNEDIVSCKGELDILYEDEYFLVVNKPSNLSSMPSIKHQTDNILSNIKYYLDNKGEKCNMHLVNRLDFQTSGLIIVSKSGIIHYEFSKQAIDKRYLCVLDGILDKDEGVIELPISRYPAPKITRYIDFENGKYAKTIYKVLNRDVDENQTLCEVKLVTGRTHQIRLHFSYLGTPLVGDKLYNEKVGENSNQELLLHAYYLSFVHPLTNQLITITKYPSWVQDKLEKGEVKCQEL